MGQKCSKRTITFERRAMGRNSFTLVTTFICFIKRDMNELKQMVLPGVVPSSIRSTQILDSIFLKYHVSKHNAKLKIYNFFQWIRANPNSYLLLIKHSLYRTVEQLLTFRLVNMNIIHTTLFVVYCSFTNMKIALTMNGIIKFYSSFQ
jgi:hypothetical protein